MAEVLGWVTLGEVHRYLGGPFDRDDYALLRTFVDATNALIARWHPEWDVPVRKETDGPYTDQYTVAYQRDSAWMNLLYADVHVGALKLACNFYNRRGSMGADFAQFDGSPTSFPGVVDAEISALLQINRHHRSIVA